MADFMPVYGKDAEPWVQIQSGLICNPRSGSTCWHAENDPLVHRDWDKVLVGLDLHFAVTLQGCQNMKGWPQRPNLPDTIHNIDPLLWCLRDLGRSEIVLSCDWQDNSRVSSKDETAYYIQCPLDANAMSDACDFLDDQRGTTSYVLRAFDEFGDWVAIDGDEDQHLLAGTPSFIQQYYDSAGGEEYVRAWYYHFDMLNNTVWDLETGLPLKYAALEYDYVGWPYPVYPKEYKRIEDIDWAPMFGDRIKSIGPVEQN